MWKNTNMSIYVSDSVFLTLPLLLPLLLPLSLLFRSNYDLSLPGEALFSSVGHCSNYEKTEIMSLISLSLKKAFAILGGGGESCHII